MCITCDIIVTSCALLDIIDIVTCALLVTSLWHHVHYLTSLWHHYDIIVTSCALLVTSLCHHVHYCDIIWQHTHQLKTIVATAGFVVWSRKWYLHESVRNSVPWSELMICWWVCVYHKFHVEQYSIKYHAFGSCVKYPFWDMYCSLRHMRVTPLKVKSSEGGTDIVCTCLWCSEDSASAVWV